MSLFMSYYVVSSEQCDYRPQVFSALLATAKEPLLLQRELNKAVDSMTEVTFVLGPYVCFLRGVDQHKITALHLFLSLRAAPNPCPNASLLSMDKKIKS